MEIPRDIREMTYEELKALGMLKPTAERDHAIMIEFLRMKRGNPLLRRCQVYAQLAEKYRLSLHSIIRMTLKLDKSKLIKLSVSWVICSVNGEIKLTKYRSAKASHYKILKVCATREEAQRAILWGEFMDEDENQQTKE